MVLIVLYPKVNPSGAALVYSTFFGAGDVQGVGVAVNYQAGAAYLAGNFIIGSTVPTTTGAYDTSATAGVGPENVVGQSDGGEMARPTPCLGGASETSRPMDNIYAGW